MTSNSATAIVKSQIQQ